MKERRCQTRSFILCDRLICGREADNNRFVPKRWILSLALALMLPSLAISDDRPPPPGNDPLVHFRPGHPRLLLTDVQLAADVAAAATDPFLFLCALRVHTAS
jgi:hypothetical protein